MGRLLGELVAAGFGFTALFYLGKWINFKYKKWNGSLPSTLIMDAKSNLMMKLGEGQ